MAKSPRPWIVSPNGPLEKLEENLWALPGQVPGAPISRRMLMARLADGRIVFIDAVPMDEATQKEIEAWGKPSILVVTNGYHRLDVHAFREKFGLTVLTPARSRARVEQRVKVDGDLSALPDDPALRAVELDGTKNGEAVMISKAPSGRVTFAFSDAMMNMQGKVHWFIRLLGSAGGPKVTRIFKLFVLADKAALRAHYQKLVETPGLARLVFCHGDTVETDAAGSLRAAAAAL